MNRSNSVLLKKAGAGHFTECAPGFLSRFHWRFLAQKFIFYGYQKVKQVSKFVFFFIPSFFNGQNKIFLDQSKK